MTITDELIHDHFAGGDADALFLHHPVPLWVYDRQTLRFLAVNDAAIAQYGYTREQFLAMTIIDIRTDADERELARLRANQGRRRSWRHWGVCGYRKADGSVVHAEITAHDLEFGGRPAVAVAAYDVTERLAAESAARDAEKRLNEAQALARIGSWQWDRATDAVNWSDELFRIAGRDKTEGAPPFASQQPLFPPTDWARLRAAAEQTVATGVPYEVQLRFLRPDGSHRDIIARGAPIPDATGQVVGMYGTVQDITDRMVREALLRTAHDELHESENRYRELIEHLDAVVVLVGLDGTIRYTSPAIEQYGYSRTELVGSPFTTLVHADDVARATATFADIVAGAGDKHEFRVYDKAGRTRLVRVSGRVQRRDGVPVSVVGVIMDITEQRRAQEQLQAAGRLEAVGRLAGGIAHDFNNLLVAINGFAELALAAAPASTPLRDDISEIIKAGNRAAALTSQLLAFSRRQELRPDCVNLADVIVGMEPMLRRLIGEDVELVVECDPTLHPVRIDTSRLEQTIMNLAVNARDAMPQGGTLRITTASTGFPDDELPKGLSPDNVAVLTVSDTGHGMDEATQAQIFEPFFTTKPLGEGTGLGLAMVYGFVKQSGGAISVTSAPGAGATFRIVLPQQQDGVTAGVGDRGAVEPGSETILLTEDEATVRTLVRRLLHTAGYRVLTAASPEAALQICRTYDGSIDLLLTDVVMPQMSGTMLAREARQLRPSMSVLFMSGYSGPALSAHGVDATVDLIHKPFTTAALSERVRAALTVMGADRN